MKAKKKRGSRRPVPTCAIYHRVSTKDQNARAATRQLREHARRLGFRVVIAAEETASAMDNRPKLDKIMDAARSGKLNAIIVWKLDRFGRSALELLSRLNELKALGVRFICSSQGIDIDPQHPNFMVDFFFINAAAWAELERQMIVSRTNLGLEYARARGVRLGRPVTPLELRQVAELRAKGKSWDEIAGELGVGRTSIRRAFERAGVVTDQIGEYVEKLHAELEPSSSSVVNNGDKDPSTTEAAEEEGSSGSLATVADGEGSIAP